jgi:hypothetical protein
MEQGTDINAMRVDKVYGAVVDALNAGKTISAQAELGISNRARLLVL